MKKLTILFMVLGLLFLGVVNAEAANVTVTSTIGTDTSFSLSESSWATTSTTVNATESSWISGIAGYIDLENTGNSDMDFTIEATITAGSSLSTSAVGTDTYMIGHGQSTDPYTSDATYTAFDGTSLSLTTSLDSGADDDNYFFDLEIKTPSVTTKGGEQQTITVTVTGSAS